MTYVTRDSEAGNIIDRFATREEAEKAIEAYEAEDANNGEYSEGFYEVCELREQINGECISYGEIVELQSLAQYIEADDVVLLEWAGVPEK